jgi:GxxExxY protein
MISFSFLWLIFLRLRTMPITSPIPPCRISQEEFKAIDYRVMRLAFACQNELGRLCDESIYQNDLTARLEAAGLGPIQREVPVVLTRGNFCKKYYLDMVIGNGAIYELKAAAQIIAEHEAQLMNYLFLLGANHGKLINFRPAQVQSRFVNTTLTPEARRQMTVDTSRWEEEGGRSRELRIAFVGLLNDWGGFLELPLYLEALIHLLGGEAQVMQTLPLTRNGVPLGNQRLQMLSPDAAFRITALPEIDAREYEKSLCSLLRHSALRAVQWLNIFQHTVHLVTLTR